MTPRQLLTAIAAIQTHVHQDRQLLLAAGPEALHDLRIDLRQLRSLLKPLGDVDGVTALLASAQTLAAKTGPLRDMEVLLDELRQWSTELAPAQAADLARARLALAHSAEMAAFSAALLHFCSSTDKQTLPAGATLSHRFRQARRRWQQHLQEAIATMPQPLAADTEAQALHRHELRLMVKHLRYNLEWQSSKADAALLQALRNAQARIGDWHDRCVWIATCREQAALAGLVATWKSELVFHADAADAALRRLRRKLR